MIDSVWACWAVKISSPMIPLHSGSRACRLNVDTGLVPELCRLLSTPLSLFSTGLEGWSGPFLLVKWTAGRCYPFDFTQGELPSITWSAESSVRLINQVQINKCYDGGRNCPYLTCVLLSLKFDWSKLWKWKHSCLTMFKSCSNHYSYNVYVNMFTWKGVCSDNLFELVRWTQTRLQMNAKNIQLCSLPQLYKVLEGMFNVFMLPFLGRHSQAMNKTVTKKTVWNQTSTIFSSPSSFCD